MKTLITLFLISFLLLICYTVSTAETLNFYYDFRLDQQTVFDTKIYIDKQLDRNHYDKLVVWICSPGGTVTASINLYDYLMALRTNGVTVETVATGVCASGATIVLQAGETRYITPFTMFLVHKAYIPDEGLWDKFQIWLWHRHELDYVNDRMFDLYCFHTGLSHARLEKELSYDHWMTYEEALDRNFADKVLSPILPKNPRILTWLRFPTPLVK